MKTLLTALTIVLLAAPAIAQDISDGYPTLVDRSPSMTHADNRPINHAFYQFPFKLGDLVTAENVNREFYRVAELERKVAGMQKQITILHAKLEQQTKRADGAASRDQLQEKKITHVVNILKLQK